MNSDSWALMIFSARPARPLPERSTGSPGRRVAAPPARVDARTLAM